VWYFNGRAPYTAEEQSLWFSLFRPIWHLPLLQISWTGKLCTAGGASIDLAEEEVIEPTIVGS
jgi:hypothetical protein